MSYTICHTDLSIDPSTPPRQRIHAYCWADDDAIALHLLQECCAYIDGLPDIECAVVPDLTQDGKAFEAAGFAEDDEACTRMYGERTAAFDQQGVDGRRSAFDNRVKLLA